MAALAGALLARRSLQMGKDACDLDSQDILDDILGDILLLGFVVSMVPQFYELWKAKSSETISHTMLFWNTLSNQVKKGRWRCFKTNLQAQVVNAFVLTSFARIVCCKTAAWSLGDCWNNNM